MLLNRASVKGLRAEQAGGGLGRAGEGLWGLENAPFSYS